MSALARYLQQNGHTVCGSDSNPNVHIDGIDTDPQNAKQNIKKADFVVTTSAISDQDPLLVFARSLGKKIVPRGQLLAWIATKYKHVIAVSGTHGKTTTTEMLAEIFCAAKLDPTVHLGGQSKFFGSNFLRGGNKFFITEACEYTNSFLFLKPDVGVVLNIEPEHLDFFETFENEQKSFLKFCHGCKTVIANQQANMPAHITFGKNANIFCTNITTTQNGYAFDVHQTNHKVLRVCLNSANQKNIENALPAIAAARHFGVPDKAVQHALANFAGVKQRFELLSNNPPVIRDYAHHPTEILAVINSAKHFFNLPVAVIFRPHTFSRTKNLLEQFAAALGSAEQVILLPTFAAREQPSAGADEHALLAALQKQNPNICARIAPTLQQAKIKIKPQFVTLILGAVVF